jgi:hypothetical protein
MVGLPVSPFDAKIGQHIQAANHLLYAFAELCRIFLACDALPLTLLPDRSSQDFAQVGWVQFPHSLAETG